MQSGVPAGQRPGKASGKNDVYRLDEKLEKSIRIRVLKFVTDEIFVLVTMCAKKLCYTSDLEC